MRLLAPLLVLACALPLAAQAQLYRWQDADGVTHYTRDAGRIPSGADAAPVVAGAVPRTPPVAAAPAVERRETPAREAPLIEEPVIEAPAVPQPTTEGPAIATPPPPAVPVAAAPSVPIPPRVETPAPRAAAPAAPVEPETIAPEPPAAPAPAVSELPPAPAANPDDPAAEIAALEAQIQESREAIRVLIGAKRWSGSELAEDPQLRALADRLPRLQQRLDVLRGDAPPTEAPGEGAAPPGS